MMCGALSLWLLVSSAAFAHSTPQLSAQNANRLAEKAARKAARRLGHSLADYNRGKPMYDPHGKPPGWSVNYVWQAKHLKRNGIMVWQVALDSSFSVFVDDKTRVTKAVFPGQ